MKVEPLNQQRTAKSRSQMLDMVIIAVEMLILIAFTRSAYKDYLCVACKDTVLWRKYRNPTIHMLCEFLSIESNCIAVQVPYILYNFIGYRLM